MTEEFDDFKAELETQIQDDVQGMTINSEKHRKLFITAMTGEEVSTDDFQFVHEFIMAVDYFVGSLGYGICDMTGKTPTHIDNLLG